MPKRYFKRVRLCLFCLFATVQALGIILSVILICVPAPLLPASLQPPLSSTDHHERLLQVVRSQQHIRQDHDVFQGERVGLIGPLVLWRRETLNVVVERRAEYLGSKGGLLDLEEERLEVHEESEIARRGRGSLEDLLERVDGLLSSASGKECRVGLRPVVCRVGPGGLEEIAHLGGLPLLAIDPRELKEQKDVARIGSQGLAEAVKRLRVLSLFPADISPISTTNVPTVRMC